MNLGILASHEGTTLQSVIDACAGGRISGRVAIVISNNSGAGALARARQAGIRAAHLSSTTHDSPETLDLAIRDALLDAGVDIVFLAGYMKPVGPRTLAAFSGRILNTHPALLPKFGGQGMYGDHVFRAVLDAKAPETGVSLHLVDRDYDAGAVIRQCMLEVLPDDTVETLKDRVRSCEKAFVVETLALIAQGQLTLGAVTTELAHLEQRLADAWMNRDRPFIDALLASDWTVTDPAGRILTKEQVLDEAFSSTERVIDAMAIDDIHVRMLGDEAAVVTGRTRASGSYQGRPQSAVLRFTDVFSHRSGRWLVVASQGTMISTSHSENPK